MNEEHFKKVTEDLLSFAKRRLGYEKDPDVRYMRDMENAKALLGYTAHYNPADRAVTVFISGRHPKDILRSVAHELVHHAQCCRGDLENRKTPKGYAQEDPHMRNMEAEAYLKGNLIFRDWEDECKSHNKHVAIKIIGENTMTKKDLISDVAAKVSEILDESQRENNPRLKKKQRFFARDRVSHKEHGEGVVVGVKNPGEGALGELVSVKWDGGGPSYGIPAGALSSLNREGTEKQGLRGIKKEQKSIESINESRLIRLNKKLMDKLLK